VQSMHRRCTNCKWTNWSVTPCHARPVVARTRSRIRQAHSFEATPANANTGADLLSHSRPLVTELEAVCVPAATSSRTIWKASWPYASGLVAAQVARRSMLPPTSCFTKAKPVPSLSAGRRREVERQQAQATAMRAASFGATSTHLRLVGWTGRPPAAARSVSCHRPIAPCPKGPCLAQTQTLRAEYRCISTARQWEAQIPTCRTALPTAPQI
jgi:hypothetical protein